MKTQVDIVRWVSSRSLGEELLIQGELGKGALPPRDGASYQIARAYQLGGLCNWSTTPCTPYLVFVPRFVFHRCAPDSG